MQGEGGWQLRRRAAAWPRFTCCPETWWHEPCRHPWHYRTHPRRKENSTHETFSSCPALQIASHSPPFPRAFWKNKTKQKPDPESKLALLWTARRAHGQVQSLLHLVCNKQNSAHVGATFRNTFQLPQTTRALKYWKRTEKKLSIGMQFYWFNRSGQHCRIAIIWKVGLKENVNLSNTE